MIKLFAAQWLDQQPKVTTKGERRLVLQFATLIDKLLEVSNDEEKN